jgi:hypothetical protein
LDIKEHEGCLNLKTLTSIITNSLGELDVLLPIIAKIKTHRKCRVNIVFATNSIYEKFSNSEDYIKLCDDLGIHVEKIEFFKSYGNDKYLFKIIKWLRYFFVNMFVLIKYSKTNIFIGDYCDHKYILRPMQYLVFLKAGTIYAIPHGLAIQQDTAVIFKVKPPKFVKMLCFDKDTIPFHRDFGYDDIEVIGYVKDFKEWKTLLLQNFQNLRGKRGEFCVIYCRDIHENFMSSKNFTYLLKSGYAAIRKSNVNIEIIFKLHPRQNVDMFKKFCKKQKFENYFISIDNPSFVVIGASFSISLWSSAILDSYFAGVPSCEYFIEDDSFLVCEPDGSIYRKLGFPSFDNKEDLFRWIKSCTKKAPISKMDMKLNNNHIDTENFLDIIGV